MKIKSFSQFHKKVSLTGLVIAASFSLAGCGAVKKDMAETKKENYVKSSHTLETVEKGDMESSYSLSLKGADYEKIDYAIDIDLINEGIALGTIVFDGCYVALGQHVKKGDLLISYTDKELDKKIKGYTDEISDKYTLIEHYEELMQIDPSNDLSNDIKDVKDRIEVLELYKQEALAKRDKFRVYAKEDGNISFVYDKVSEYQGYIWEPTSNGRYIVVSETTGSSVFSATTEEENDFKVGDVYEATSSLNKYKMKITDVEKTGGVTKLTFVPEDEDAEILPDAALSLVIDRPVMKDVIYVNSKAIKYTSDEKPFVYTVDENGFRHAVMVELGERIDNNVIILSGLSGGEEVSID